MTASQLVFYGLSALIIGFSIVVVTTRHLFRGALALTFVLALIGGLFALLGADFLAAAQWLIYVGGIMVLVLFVVMYVQSPDAFRQPQTGPRWLGGLLLSGALATLLIRLIVTTRWPDPVSSELLPTTARMGRLLLGDWLVPFEVVSLVLLAALVGAAVWGLEREP